MKFKSRYAMKDCEGLEKIVRKFLWFPSNIRDEKERRWLEVADVVYRVERIRFLAEEDRWKWQQVRFATTEDYKSLPNEIPYEDVGEMMHNLVVKPSFWLIVDSLALTVAFWNMRDGLTLLLTVKAVQAFFLISFDRKE
jgi:hypothetical protein